MIRKSQSHLRVSHRTQAYPSVGFLWVIFSLLCRPRCAQTSSRDAQNVEFSRYQIELSMKLWSLCWRLWTVFIRSWKVLVALKVGLLRRIINYREIGSCYKINSVVCTKIQTNRSFFQTMTRLRSSKTWKRRLSVAFTPLIKHKNSLSNQSSPRRLLGRISGTTDSNQLLFIQVKRKIL
jgi:hypothetical protein